jgi:hypothetical protein
MSSVQAMPSSHEVGQASVELLGSHVSVDLSTVPSPQLFEQSESDALTQPIGQHLSPLVHSVTGTIVHFAVHCCGSPSIFAVKHGSLLVQGGQLLGGSQVSPFSRAPLPQVGAQSGSMFAFAPTGQQPSIALGDAGLQLLAAEPASVALMVAVPASAVFFTETPASALETPLVDVPVLAVPASGFAPALPESASECSLLFPASPSASLASVDASVTRWQSEPFARVPGGHSCLQPALRAAAVRMDMHAMNAWRVILEFRRDAASLGGC